MTGSVTFDVAIGGDGSTVTDDDNATTGLRDGGWRTRFVPCFTNQVSIANYVVTKANEAAASQTAAANSATAAAASYDSFDDRYLGAKSSNPTVDNDGNALLTGALYWNTTNSEMRVYSGSTWITSYLPASGYLALSGGTMTGNIVFAAGQTFPVVSPSVVRSAKTSAYTIVAGDKGNLIEVTSGTFTLSLTAAATLDSGWWCYVSNIGSGLITIDPNSDETITVNGEALSTWVQWSNEIGLLQCDGTGFHYYQIQKGTITQTVSSAVASIVFSGGLAYRKNMLLSWDNGDLTATDQISLKLNTSVGPANSYGFRNSAGSLSAITGANDNFTLGAGAGAGYSATARFNGQAMFTLSDNAIVAVINSKYFLSPNLSGGQTTSLFSSINRTTITNITIIPNSQTIASGTFTLKEL